MFALRRYALPRRLQVVLGLALMGLVFAPTASAAAPLDTVTATGGGSGYDLYTSVNISAESDSSGQNPAGSVSFHVGQPPSDFAFSGPVTCLSVTGPDHGAGTLAAPTTAVMNAQTNFGLETIQLVDNGGGGVDAMFAAEFAFRAPSDCSPISPPFTVPLTSGRAVVFDVPLLPTSKAQCKNGGWRSYGTMFKNQGQCVAFVVTQARQKCLAERGKIGVQAFRNKYGLGRYHVLALLRCVNRASR